MNYEQLSELMRFCLLEIFYRDNILLDRLVREECVNHRLAYYIEVHFDRVVRDDMLYVVDLEYNKNLSRNDKKVEIADGNIISIRPDIIIHQRNSNAQNLIAIEAKLSALRNHDRVKLRRLILHPFNYQFSVGIQYNPTRTYFSVEIFRIVNGIITVERIRFQKQ